MVRLPALGPRAGHHHPGEVAERRIRARGGDRHAAGHLPENLQPVGPLRCAFLDLWAQQSRDGLRAWRRSQVIEDEELVENAARMGEMLIARLE